MEDKMTEVRSELMQFKVTPQERKLIERCAQKEKTTVSDYIRGSLLMEMVLDGEIEALKIIATTIGRKAVKAMQKRAERFRAIGGDAEPGT
jgi:uncharacterized protein (DUF1778 family)